MKRAILVCLLTAGCVSAGKYDDLAARHAALQAELVDTRQKRDADVTARDVKIADLEGALAAEQERARSLEANIRKLEGDLAAIMKDKSKLSASVQQMQAALADAQKRKAEADARIAEFRSLLARFRDLIDAGKLRVKIVEGRMVVELATDVLFPSGSATLSKDGRAAIEEVAKVLAEIPGRKFQVEGHTDNVPISTAQYPSNWELAAARAVNVVRRMVEAGMPQDRISAASFGESKPAVANDSAENKARNRRIEIVLVPDLSSLPGFDELNRAASGS